MRLRYIRVQKIDCASQIYSCTENWLCISDIFVYRKLTVRLIYSCTENWLCVSDIFVYRKKPTRCTICLQYIYVKHRCLFRAYLQPIIRRYTICIQQQVLIIHFRWLSNHENSHLKRTVSTCCHIHTVYLLMKGYRHARNKQRCLTKYTEDKLHIKFFFLHTNTS